jgi:hypothetical protein
MPRIDCFECPRALRHRKRMNPLCRSLSKKKPLMIAKKKSPIVSQLFANYFSSLNSMIKEKGWAGLILKSRCKEYGN